MKRNSGADELRNNVPQLNPAHSHELEGLVEMGMAREALRLARRTLKAGRISPEAFCDAIHAIVVLGDALKTWRPLVESAYARLPKRGQRSARCWLLFFHFCNKNYEAAARFIPRTFDGEFGHQALAYACDTLLELGKMEEAERLARKLPRAIQSSENPLIQSQLLQCLAEYFVRSQDWDKAIAPLEISQLEPTLSCQAVLGIVEIHVARALLAIQRGLQLVEKFNGEIDPEMELALPGNNKAIQQDAAKRFRRLQKLLERIVPKERQKELGICG